MKLPCTITSGGLAITFERVSCLEYITYSPTNGLTHDPVAYTVRPCKQRMRWMGQGTSSVKNSQRVGLCRKHMANDFDDAALAEWQDSDFAHNHIYKMADSIRAERESYNAST